MNVLYLKKLKWSCLHFSLGVIVLSIVGYFIYSQWFYAGRHYLTDLVELALIIISVDLVLGPMLSFWLLSPNKTYKENMANLLVIVLLQLLSLGYGIKQVDGQRLAYIVKWQTSYFAVSKSDARGVQALEHFYVFKEPAIDAKSRALYNNLIKQSVSPVEMNEFFVLSDFETECEMLCGVITKKGIVNVTKMGDSLVFNKSLR